MKTINIYPNRKRVRSEFRFFFWFVVVFALGIGVILLLQNEDSTSQGLKFDDVILILFAAYACLYAINEIIRMYRFDKLKGPVLKLTSDGITDFLYLKGELKWADIQYLGWRRSGGRHSYEYFVIHPANPNWKYWLQRTYSYPMKYKLTRLSVPDANTPQAIGEYETVISGPLNKKRVSQFLKEFAPWSIRRKRKKKFEKFISYAVLGGCVIVLFWIHIVPRLGTG